MNSSVEVDHLPTGFGDVILLPGLLCDARLWADQVDGLEKLARVTIPDLSVGESIRAMADAVLAQAPSQFALAGFSMGGLVALEIVARVPERVRRLALLSTNASGVLPLVRRHLQNSIDRIEVEGLDAYLRNAFPLYVALGRADDHALWEIFSEMAKRVGPVVGVRQMRALLDYPGFSHDLGRIACPTIVIGGDEDRRTPVAAHQEFAGQIPGSKFCLIKGAGHFTPLEEPLAVSEALVGWLTGDLFRQAGARSSASSNKKNRTEGHSAAKPQPVCPTWAPTNHMKGNDREQ
jgi:pimeloyl-ACP methyl ester carboxylesterase